MIPPVPAVFYRADASPIRALSSRKPDTMGRVLIPEYHNIMRGRGPMYRTPAQLRADLERMWRLGFRPVTVREYVENRMELPRGASPVVMTFDDSSPTQLKLRKDGTVDPQCAVGVMMAFAKAHPDFPAKATFYVLPRFFDQRHFREQKLRLLLDLGCEIASHTMTHPDLARCSDVRVKRELAGAIEFLTKLGVPGPYSFAAPYGLYPRNRALVAGFTYKGKKYAHASAAFAYYGAARSPNDARFNRFALDRIVSCPGDEGIDDYLDRARRNRIRLYVAK